MTATYFLESPRFPDDIAYGSSGGPTFQNYVFEGQSGVEQTTVGWTRAKNKYKVTYDIRDKANMDIVRAFFYNVKGKGTRFRFKDWSDYELIEEPIGVGDGATVAFQIIKTYTTGSVSYVRQIFKPVNPSTVSSDGVSGDAVPVFNVYVSGVIVSPSTYSVSWSSGIITFTSPPASGAPIAVDCDFDVPVRFDTDALDAKHEGYLTESWGTVPLVEVILPPPQSLSVTPSTGSIALTRGTSHSVTLAASGGSGSYVWTYTGTLYPGATFNSSTLVLSGTPTTDGTYAATFQVFDTATGQSGSVTYTWTVTG